MFVMALSYLYIQIVYSNYLLNFMGKVYFFRNCLRNDCQFGVWYKIFFVFTGLNILTGLHQSIWHIGFTRMAFDEAIQVINM